MNPPLAPILTDVAAASAAAYFATPKVQRSYIKWNQLTLIPGLPGPHIRRVLRSIMMTVRAFRLPKNIWLHGLIECRHIAESTRPLEPSDTSATARVQVDSEDGIDRERAKVNGLILDFRPISYLHGTSIPKAFLARGR